MSLVDSHAHLDARCFDGDRREVLARAATAGVAWIINAGADIASSFAGVALAERYPCIYAAAGVHPHNATKLTEETLAALAKLAHHPKVVAIGEIGLDFYRDLSPRPQQRAAFRQQLDLARRVCKPVIVHSRDAHTETMEILTNWAAGSGHPGAVLHCFSGDLAVAEQAVALGFFIGVAGPVTFQNARQLPETVRRLPLDRLLVETDCPYLSPYPYRGQRNEPAYVRLVAERIAEIKGLDLSEIAAATTVNAQRLFLPAAR